MNPQENSIKIFKRLSTYVVNKHSMENTSSHNYMGQLINNMQHINQLLMSAAIRIITKLRDNKEINKEILINELKQIIHGSVAEYAKRA
ncbi:MAG: hypothetical protein JST82_10680 [Bacteroidetes bacterium]|nr:hypothetical protein [Bacteroidota bacterium]